MEIPLYTGHNFGMEHDGQGSSTCGANDGLMGYGNGQGFSSCSITALRQYFAGNGGLTCLGSGYYNGKFSSNYNDDVNPAPTQRPTARPTTRSPTRRPTARPTTSNSNPTPRPTARPTTRSPTNRPTTNTASSDDSDDWECVGIKNFGLDTYNGYWSYKGEYPDYTDKPYYVHNSNGAYLYYHPYYKIYLMSNILGSISVFGYCGYSDVTLCVGNNAFKYAQNGAWVTDNDAEVYDCTDNTDSGQCENYECLSILGMYPDKYGTSYDGKWEPAGCHNGESYYIRATDTSSPPSRYLCYSEYYDLWIISNELCGAGAFAYCPSSTTDILKTANNWNIATNSGWGRDSQVYLYDCGGFGGYLDETVDLSCLDNNQYNDKLCITTANDTVDFGGNDTVIYDTLWNGNRTFEIYTKQCQNGKPIYYYTDYTLIDDGKEDVFGNVEQENIENIYYLHYHKELLYSDGNQTIGQWIISKDEISINAVGICEKEDLLDCKASSWLIDAVDFDDIEYFDSEGRGDTLLEKIIDQYMELNNEQCANDVVIGIDVNENDDEDDTAILIILILICIFICVVISGALIYRKMNKNENKNLNKLAGASPVSQKEVDLDDIEPELEVSMERDGETGAIITYAYH